MFVFVLILPVILLFSCRTSRYTGQEKQIALTFDDGPDSIYTRQVLRVLKRHHVHATFYLIGSEVEKYPSLVKMIDAGGHCIGNHSYHHLNFWNLSCDQLFQNEILHTQDLIYGLTGKKPRFYRPPYGYLLDSCASRLSALDYIVNRWDIDPRDWDITNNSVKGIEEYVYKAAADNCVILMHCGNGDRSKTVQALPGIINYLKGENYRFVTIDELMGTRPYFP
jgi:peptidoglycan-N-acetylglucosamine deacetylase